VRLRQELRTRPKPDGEPGADGGGGAGERGGGPSGVDNLAE